MPQYLGLYLGSGWVALEFTDWIVNRFLLSPAWTDLVLALWLCGIPALLLISYTHGRPGADPWTWGQRVFLGLNCLVAVALLALIGATRDLSPQAQAVALIDESGQSVSRVVAQAPYRQRLAVFPFETDDENVGWARIGFPTLLEVDLYQDIFLTVSSSSKFVDAIRQQGLQPLEPLPLALKRQLADQSFSEGFVSGKLRRENGVWLVDVQLYETDTGAIRWEAQLEGPNLFELGDKINTGIKEALDIPAGRPEAVVDLPAAELLTQSEEAYAAASAGFTLMHAGANWPEAAERLAEAVRIDPTFAFAHTQLYAASILSNDGERAQQAIEKAMKHLYRLPERLQFAVKGEYYWVIEENQDKAMAVLEMQGSLYPGDPDAHRQIAQLYEMRLELEEAISAQEKVLANDPSQLDVLLKIGLLEKQRGQYDRARDAFERYVTSRPQDAAGPLQLGRLAEAQGDAAAAVEYFERAAILDENSIEPLLGLAWAEIHKGEFRTGLEAMNEALDRAGTEGQKASVEEALKAYYELRGQIENSLRHFDRQLQHVAVSQPPIYQALGQLTVITAYSDTGRPGQIILERMSSLPSPFRGLKAFAELLLASANGEKGEIRRLLPEAEQVTRDAGFLMLTPALMAAEGRALELEGELEAAYSRYSEAVELEPRRTQWRGDAARALRLLNRLDEARSEIDLALRPNPYDGKLNLEAAKIAEAASDPDSAARFLARALHTWAEADSNYRPAQRAMQLAQQNGELSKVLTGQTRPPRLDEPRLSRAASD